MNILTIKTSARGDQSVSNLIVSKITEKLLLGKDIIVKDEDLSFIPFVDENQVLGNPDPISDKFISNLEWADVIVIGCPTYNFNVPGKLKAWFDQIAIAGKTFQYTEDGPVGLLKNKKVFIAMASGGTSAGGDYDFGTPWLKFALGFIGITDITIISADGVAADYNASLAKAYKELDALFL